jgi:EAL domain-containing protein (putative c-di-GMP-specific phosphodiesterase class I)
MTISRSRTAEITVVAEGVKTEEPLRFLRAHACGEWHGILFSPAVSGDVVTDILKKELNHSS